MPGPGKTKQAVGRRGLAADRGKGGQQGTHNLQFIIHNSELPLAPAFEKLFHALKRRRGFAAAHAEG